jgi:undecaprenyldiphospho-muramoylpentapeptide beta-N-acetylglucosaminyltransferase
MVLAGVNIQPSEFVKPAFVVLISWLFAESAQRPEMPANTIAIALLLGVISLLVLQPDFGQTMLIALVWGALFFMAGMRWIWVAGLGGTAVLGLVGAYFTVPHVAKRIRSFLDKGSADTFNIDIALESFARGGWFGTGPGEGTVKRMLPESHTDFVFAVAGEEFGVVLCLILVSLFAFVVMRALTHAMREHDPFNRFAAAGLAMLFGLQSAINMAVNLHLMPAKGMTLPFISYGGSSMISLAYGMGMLLAVTRERPRAEQLASGNGFAPALVLLAAGGTGGHLFPAEALAGALARHGVTVDLATDARAGRYGGGFPARATHVIPSDTLRGRNPLSLAKTVWNLGLGFGMAYAMLGRLRPAAVVGFGGYPSIPPLAAAAARRIPTVIHEQNGVMGRANRLLAPYVTAIATSFPGVLDASPALARKATLTGNPVRPVVIAAAATPYARPAAEGKLTLLVFGGSQGARIMSDIAPLAIERLDAATRGRLKIVQQARGEDVARVREFYTRLGVGCEVAPFFSDLPARIAAAQLVVSRAGASTVAELSAIGRPAILVPLPHALDQDQLANATVLGKAGGAIVLTQDLFTPERLAQELRALADAPDRLAAMAAAARSAGAPDAADRLADLVLRVANVIPARR